MASKFRKTESHVTVNIDTKKMEVEITGRGVGNQIIITIPETIIMVKLLKEGMDKLLGKGNEQTK